MAVVVYCLCAVTSFLCAALLLRGYRQTRKRLLLWSGVCFVGLTLDNVFLLLDKLVFPHADLIIWRRVPGMVGLAVLLYGLIWETD